MVLSANARQRLSVALASAGVGDEVADALDTVAALSAAEAAFIDGVTAGTAAASKALVLDANKRVGDIGGLQFGSTAVTATVGGGTTGLIPANASHVTITSDTATKQVSLPAANVGHKMTLFVGANGCELISAVAAHEVNDVVVGATNELALGANTHYHCEYVAANKWIVRGFTSLGADQAALVPDAL